ncbi:MAG: hypothetical protein ACFCU3_12245, partial [Verrucomicrobiales bacterium]
EETPIIHLHGPKPFDREDLYHGNRREVSHFNRGHFELFSELWFELLAEVMPEAPGFNRDADLLRSALVQAQSNNGQFVDADLELLESFKRRGRRIENLQETIKALKERLLSKEAEIERLHAQKNPLKRLAKNVRSWFKPRKRAHTT